MGEIFSLKQKNEKGIVYCAVGEKYAKECKVSLDSLIDVGCGLPVTVFTDNVDYFAEAVYRDFSIQPHPDPSFNYFDKIQSLACSPYAETIFIDTDTRLFANPEELFKLLDKFDLAVSCETHSPAGLSDVPLSFPEFNTGVIIINNKSAKIPAFLKSWQSISQRMRNEKRPCRHDQPSFREALFFSDIRFCPLPSDWNFHLAHIALLNSGAKIKILHRRNNGGNLPDQVYHTPKHSLVFLPDVGCLHPDRIFIMNPGWNACLGLLLLPTRLLNALNRKLFNKYN